jgi:ABC-2 type transport system permease protein
MLLTGENAQLEVIINTESGAGTTAQWAIQLAVNRLYRVIKTAEFSAMARSEVKPFATESEASEYFHDAIGKTVLAWGEPPVIIAAAFIRQDMNEEYEPVNAFTHSSPGMMVQFAIAGLIGAAEILVLERKSGALQRLLTTPMRHYEVLLGHFFAMVMMIFTQFLILILFAQIFLDVPYFSAPLATFLVALCTATFAASMGLLISTFAKTSEQVVVFSLIPMFILSGLGGAWVPIEFTGETFQRIAYMTPLAWSMTGFKNIIERGQGIESVIIPIGILLTFSVILSGLAVWKFKFKEA